MQSPSTPSTTPRPEQADASTWKSDLVSGFLVFLIALPLCLGIAMASGFPPVSGILTAVVGGILSSWLGSARLTIKGPAAGLIVIALGAVQELGQGDMALGYRRALATIAVAAAVQIAFALLRAGTLGDFFPSSVVHGMLAAIGVIICSKQVHTLLGVAPKAKEPLALLGEIPQSLGRLNPEIALIGVISLVLLFGHMALSKKVAFLKRVPAPLLVLLVAVPMGLYFDLDHEHTFTFSDHLYSVGPNFLVNLPGNLLSAITFPDFSAVASSTSIKYIVMFSLVGSIESLLSAKAVDMLDPQKRRSDLDKDLLATGVGNLIAGLLGGLPMISEIVRSSANIGYGAKSRLSNFFHGLFLLLFVTFAPMLIHRIPLAALAAMLIFTGVRLASPSEFVKTFRIGAEQLTIFSFTLVVTLATDLLVGVAAGIVLKLVVHVLNGAPIGGLFRPAIEEQQHGDKVVLRVRHAAVFSNYLKLKKQISKHAQAKHVELDLEDARLVDHTVMERLHELEDEFSRAGRHLHIRGLDQHRGLSTHPLAARKKLPGNSPVGAQ
ncbi:SulP family inorganic anion transporter [Archangium violaceum]|uniref:Sulfate transporter n=1 Tax=Archangium violaceum Cb vi76 TaxID=1406225 RepID=A0A084SML7_9BACT|nr:SulP family inorganic anion transporter [Archangium violaceum]KFA89702.1 sulfate transporter [Archangium violaceum Cb vi76]